MAHMRTAAGQCSWMLKICPTSAMAAPVEMVPTACSVVDRALILLAGDGAAKVEDGDHGHYQQVAHAPAELIPVRGDEEDYAAGEENSAED